MTREEILTAAKECVCQSRELDYSSPENSFTVIAEMWQAYLKGRCLSPLADVVIGASDVAAMMVLFKMARVATGRNKSDNWIDAAGYAACGGEVQEDEV